MTTTQTTENEFKPSSTNVITLLRYTSLIEGISLLLLVLIAMPLKYIADMPIYVRYIGMAHGLLFILLVLMLFVAASKVPVKWLLLTLLASVIPFGAFVMDIYLKRLDPSCQKSA